MLCSEGKHFCAGADFSRRAEPDPTASHLYDEAARIFRQPIPIVAAIQGAAVGGGLGLAMAADFRVGCEESRFSANFARLGFHHGFALSVTLPGAVGQQQAARMLFTGARHGGITAREMGLIDQIVERTAVREAGLAMAGEIAASAPLAVRSIRATLRSGLAEAAIDAMQRERAEQERLQQTDDWREGVAAMSERRTPMFRGQ